MTRASTLGAAMAAVLGGAACAATVIPRLQQESAGRVGCLPSEVAISDYQRGSGSDAWVATCRGKQYVCSMSTASATACNERK